MESASFSEGKIIVYKLFINSLLTVVNKACKLGSLQVDSKG